jgi:hypothetical protein
VCNVFKVQFANQTKAVQAASRLMVVGVAVFVVSLVAAAVLSLTPLSASVSAPVASGFVGPVGPTPSLEMVVDVVDDQGAVLVDSAGDPIRVRVDTTRVVPGEAVQVYPNGERGMTYSVNAEVPSGVPSFVFLVGNVSAVVLFAAALLALCVGDR